MRSMEIRFKLNGGQAIVNVPGAMSLQRVLRDVLNLTGTKDGCREGECGACTVLLDREPVDSCLVPICQVRDREVITIEAFDLPENREHPLIRSFLENGAVQCGFCTPGFIMSASALLHQNRHPDDSEIRTHLAGNICRCTGYDKIFKAVRGAGKDFFLPAGTEKLYRGVAVDPEPVHVVSISNLEEFANSASDFGPDMRFLAGGTDLMVQKSNRLPCGSVWVDISGCAELKRIEVKDNVLHIGSLVTYHRIAHDPLIVKYAPALVETARDVGSEQIRRLATLGGNLANAAPCADGYPTLVALNAWVTTQQQNQTRTIPVDKLNSGLRKTTLNPGELIREICIPVTETLRSGYLKFMPRRAQGIAKVLIAVAMDVQNGKIIRTGIGLGSVGPTVIRVTDVENELTGVDTAAVDPEKIAVRVAAAARPIDDFRSTADYRRRIVGIGVKRILIRLLTSD